MRTFVLALTVCWLVGVAETSRSAEPVASNRRVHIFYYAWYGVPDRDGTYHHWNQNERLPPDDIASSFYPRLGPYSSTDTTTVEQHMAWIASAGIGVVIFAWQDDAGTSKSAVGPLMDAAWHHGLKVAFLIDQNPPKRPAEMLATIERITSTYGTHPAFFRVERPTRSWPGNAPRGLFYLFDPFLKGHVDPSEWAPLVEELRGTYYDAVLLGQGLDLAAAERAHFDGIFTFDVLKVNPGDFRGFEERARQARLIFVPTIGPGYDDRRAAHAPAGQRSRDLGSLYDRFWEAVIDVEPEWVSLYSFNEWHEGTQIEPARPMETPLVRYDDYLGAYGETGESAEMAYLNRTAFWIAHFLKTPLMRP